MRLRRCLLSFVLVAASGLGAAAASRGPCVDIAERVAQLKAGDGYQATSALIAAARLGCVDEAQGALDAGATLDGRDRLGATALARAAEAGKEASMALLMAKGADVNARAVDGSTPLFLAALSGRAAAAHRLLEAHADVSLTGKSSLTPLAAAAYGGAEPLVADLIEHGADPNVPDATGKTAILYAATRGFASVTRRLLDAGVDVNHTYEHNLTALMWAAGYADGAGVQDAMETIELLIARGATLDLVDDRGMTALAIARSVGHAEAADLLERHGASETASAQSPAK